MKSSSWLSDLLGARDEFPEPPSLRFRHQANIGRRIGSVRALNSRILSFGRRQSLRFTVLLAMWIALLLVVQFLIDVAFQDLSWGPAFYLTYLAALAIACVHVAYERFRFHRWSIAILSDSPWVSADHWLLLQRIFSPLPQVFAAILGSVWVGCLGWAMRSVFPSASAPVLWFLWSVILGTLIGNGGYWALMTPEYLKRVVGAPSLLLDPLSPASTPGLRALSSMLGTYAIMNALAFTSVMIGIAALFPADSEWRQTMLWGHAAAGGAVVIYSFIFPQLMLARVVTRHKALAEAQLIEKLRTCVENETTAGWRFRRLNNQLEALRRSPATPVAAAVIWKYLTSALVPLVGFLLVNREVVQLFVRAVSD